ncbi:TPA: hypothetical protein I8Y21_005853 [Klebsiella oxytoca]|uniref:Uncharacterized protein n=1 Tax=Klebsiella oxytoca TaxID=571 RepID=A0AAN5RH04_KLEOX|nr:hypothetical protein [Klebsiella oxytoca]
MKLSNPELRKLIEYASDNGYCVDVCFNYARVDGVYGNPVFIHNSLDGFIIYKGRIEEERFITPDEFKRLFAKR